MVPENNDLVVDEQTSVINEATAPTNNFDDPNSVDYVGEPTVVDKEFVYVNHLDPARQADRTGVYLDDKQRREAEIIRAQIEDREPDLVNPPATQGTPMITMGQAVHDYPASSVMGVVDKTVTLPASVGVADENLDGYGDAIKRRNEAAGAEEPVVNPNEDEQSDTPEEEPNQEVGDPASTPDNGTDENKTVTFS